MFARNRLRGIKRSFAVGVSLALYPYYFVSDAIKRAAKQGTCVVLYYHSIPAKLRQQFGRQLDAMLSYAVPVDLSRGTPDIKRRHFVLTFDDGLQDFYDNALPELRARNVPCVLFAVSGALGKVARWGESYYGELLPIMSDETLRRITEFITVGSHTVNHVKLTETNVEHARQEITHSRKQLQQLLGTEIQYFSFPEGEYNQTLLNLCREVGYRHVFTTSPTLAFTSGDDFLVGRVATDADDWLIETRLKILGAYRWLPVAFRLSSAIRKRIVRK